MIYLAALCLISVAVVGLRALPRPVAEMIVDALYWLAQRSYAAAVSGDRALVAYRDTKQRAQRDTTREYETTRAAGASGCPSMEVA